MRRFLLLALPLSLVACAGAPAGPATGPGAAAPAAPSAAAPASNAKITDVLWSWQRVRAPGEPPDSPQRYTVDFAPGGKLFVHADCIIAGGSWLTDGPQMKITSSLRLEKLVCQPGWSDRELIRGLENAESHELRGGELVIKTGDSQGTMRFRALPRPAS